jgi:enamine deaminase RidA (YjgF/YER057c/UK114 family)
MRLSTVPVVRETVLFGLLSMLSAGVAAENPPPAGVKTINADRAAGTSAAVVVDGLPLAFTAQISSKNAESDKMEFAPQREAEALLQRLDRALRLHGASLETSVKLNFYVTQPELGDVLRKALSGTFRKNVLPAVSFVQTRLPGKREKSFAVDAVAFVADKSFAPTSSRLGDLDGRAQIRHVATLPVGPRVFVSGQAEKGKTLAEATTKTMRSLEKTLRQLDCDPKDVVQVKCFLTPMADVAQVEKLIVDFFAPNPAPPCVFVEWQSALPVEIELVAAARPKPGPQEPLEFITPPGMKASPAFCRVVRVNDPRTIFVSGLYSREPADGAGQAADAFAQLQEILKASGGDMRHLAKATYYVGDEDASNKLNEIRPKYFDPKRPPAASKVQVFGVGAAGRSLTLDMIAVPAK